MTARPASRSGRAHRILAVDPCTDRRWERFATGATGSLFTSPPWLRAVCRTYGFAARARLAVSAEGALCGGLAWVPVDDLRGRRRVSLPFSDRADPAGEPAVVAALLDDGAAGTPWTLRALEPTPLTAVPGVVETGRAAWHATPLDGDLADLRARLHHQPRRNVAVAARRGVRVRRAPGVAGARAVHALHVRRRKERYRLLAPPARLFEEIVTAFGDDTVVALLAEVDGEVVAGALFLEWDGVLYYKFGASRAEALALRPNDALFWAGIAHGVGRGLRALDWGVSDLDQPGLVAYKDRWATHRRTVVTARTGPPVPSTGVDALLTSVTAWLTEPGVPDTVTARAGSELYRYFC
ncbi:GNAT family N-acetyltransferase [Actinomycetospora sp. CA-101289]|uniref:GNAT family N-acetyltransferase n=1 Tax=Actinomycetospora sp. CA-101289 TaxID=3239893 RepID=UPI003D98FB09